MPHPGVGFPIPPFSWPHVGRQWPEYNIESDQAEGLMAWWPTLASAGAGVLRELSGRFEPLVGVNSPSWDIDVKMGPVPYFNDSSYFITAGNVPTPDYVTISLWIKIITKDSWEQYWTIGSNRLRNTTVAVPPFSIRAHIYSTAGNVQVTAVASQNVDTWQLYTVTFDGAFVRIYCDGLLANSGVLGGTWLPGAVPFWLGAGPDVPMSDGWLADPRVYGRALPPALIWQMAHPPTIWELHRPPPRRWVLAPEVAVGQPMMLRGTTVPGLRQWHPRVG